MQCGDIFLPGMNFSGAQIVKGAARCGHTPAKRENKKQQQQPEQTARKWRVP
jgi:hypothetical protein